MKMELAGGAFVTTGCWVSSRRWFPWWRIWNYPVKWLRDRKLKRGLIQRKAGVYDMRGVTISGCPIDGAWRVKR